MNTNKKGKLHINGWKGWKKTQTKAVIEINCKIQLIVSPGKDKKHVRDYTESQTAISSQAIGVQYTSQRHFITALQERKIFTMLQHAGTAGDWLNFKMTG